MVAVSSVAFRDVVAGFEALPVIPRRASPVLVVTQEPGSRRAIERALEPRGIPVVATWLADAVAMLLDRDPFACVIIDLDLPHLAGQELVQACRAAHPEIPVIVMAQQRLEAAFTTPVRGVGGYLPKPLSETSVGSLVERVVTKRPVERALKLLSAVLLH